MRTQRCLRHLVIVVSVVVWSCGGATTPMPSGPVSSGSFAVPGSPAAVGSTGEPPSPQPSDRNCPNPQGGECLGDLSAGTYTTQTFELPITYTVPDGWQNVEDLPGNFLLVPPSQDAGGGDAGTDEYIGVYLRTVATHRGCATPAEAGTPEPGVGPQPWDIAAEFRSRPGITATEPSEVSIGGLSGLVMDVSVDPSWTGTCFYWQSSPVVPLIRGMAPSDFDHSLIAGYLLRLYLLEYRGGTLAIEVAIRDGQPLTGYEDVVRSFEFGPEASQSPQAEVPPGLVTPDTLGRALAAGARQVASPFRVPFALTLPEGWQASGLSGSHVTFETTGSGGGSGWLGIYVADGVFPDPCHRDMPVSAPTSVDGLAEAFAELAGFEATEYTAQEIDGRHARSLRLSNDIDTDSAGCERGPMLPLFTREGAPEGEATNGGTTLLMWIVDAGDVPLLIVGDSFRDATDEAVLRGIAASLDL